MMQEKQMTTVDEKNIHVVGIDDVSSDDLDEVMKTLFQDPKLKETNLCSVNSINWARIMMQMVHFFYSYFCATQQDPNKKVYISIPSGAFGNGLAAILSVKMGNKKKKEAEEEDTKSTI